MSSSPSTAPAAAGRPRLRGIRAQFALATGVAGIVFGLVLTGLLQVRAEARETAAAREALDRTARRIADRLAGDLVAREHELALIADLLRGPAADDAGALRLALDGLARRERSYAWIGFADPSGRVLAASQGVLQGRDVSARPWFSGALKAPYFGDPHEAVLLAKELPAEPGGEPLRFVDVALAVHGRDGAVQGVLGGHLHWRWVRDVVGAALAQEHRAYPLDVLIADRTGAWLVKPDAERSRGLATLVADHPDQLIARAGSVTGAGAPGLGWTVVVRTPEREALTAMHADRRLLLTISVALSALFTWLSWRLAARVVRPIEQLAAEAAQLRADQRRTPQFGQARGARETEELATLMTHLVGDLQAQSAQLALFVEHAPAALAMLDDELRFLTVSLRWLDDFQLDHAAVIGRRLEDVLAQVPPHWRAAHRRALRGTHEALPEQPLALPDGTTRWFCGELRPWFRSHGGIGGVMQFVDDVTDARRAQDRIAALNADLSAQVVAQTAELRQAKQVAEAATRAKSAFLASMSHEIRTPMNGVIGMTHLLQRTRLDARQADYVGKILASGRHLLAIINNILDLSRIEADKLALDVRDVELEALLGDVVAIFAQEAAQKGLELVVDLDPALPANVAGDPLRIGQILINFVSNAIKFTDAGAVVVAVSTTATEGPPGLRFEVTDSGPGLTPEQSARLFSPFEQVDAAALRRGQGSGLGLAISRRLAGLMGGAVGVLSTPGAGSSFWFEMPLAAIPAPLHDAAGARATPVRVLLLEENAPARRALARMIAAAAGGPVVACTEAAAAHAALADPAIAVALVGEPPGESDCMAFARAARARRPDLRLLLLARDPERDGLRARAAAAGFRDVLAKPLLPRALHAVLQGAGLDAASPLAGPANADRAITAPSALVGARVLLAEDNPINRLVASEMMKVHGIEVDVAEDGAQAVEKATGGGYDLVFMDVQMPVLDGLQAARAIRGRAGLASLPIVAMTANAFDSDREACLAAGMDDYLSKPIDPGVLLEKLQQWLAWSRRR